MSFDLKKEAPQCDRKKKKMLKKHFVLVITGNCNNIDSACI